MKSIETEFKFLVDKALTLGVKDAKVIPASDVIVENRVRLKCMSGCVTYGKKLTCPPYAPSPDEFRKILSEYRCALLVKFSSDAKVDPDIIRSIYKYWLDPEAPSDKKDGANEFWKDYHNGTKMNLPIMLELEKTAFNAGYTFAIAFSNGSCRHCEKCNVKEKICIHPNITRFPEHAVGINMKKTAEKANMPIVFPCEEHPEPMSILLID